MSLLNFKDLDSSNSDEHLSERSGKQSVFKSALPELTAISLENLTELAESLPSFSQIYFLWSLKSFNAFSFIHYVLSQRQAIDELVISSYNITREIFIKLLALLDEGSILTMHLTLSDVAKSRFPLVYDLVNSEASRRDNLEVLYLWNHSKVTLMRCGSDHFIVEGSGNFSENSRHEQYVFLNNPQIYEFRSAWIKNSIN